MKEYDLDFYKTIADESIVGLVAADFETGQIVYLNATSKQLLETGDTDDLSKLNLELLYPTETSHGRFRGFSKEMHDLEGVLSEILLRKSNGQTFISNLGLKHINISGKKHLALWIQDTTVHYKLQREITLKQDEIKSAFEDLLSQNQKLKELDIAKDRFISLTTHELRTPLSAMVASSEILKLKLYDTDEQLEEFITMIYDQGQQLLELVNDILDLAKVKAGNMDLFIEQNDVIQSVASKTRALTSMADAENIDITIKPNENSPILAYFDKLRLDQILGNIINNAIKYNKPNGSIVIWIEEKSEFIEIHVKDTGQGIPADKSHLVFDEFETLGKMALHSQGTGLGMPITKRMIEGMGGQIKLTSVLGEGSVFWIEIPKNKILEEDLYRSRSTSDFDLSA